LSSTVFRIKLRYIPQKDLDSVLESISKYFKVEVMDIRKRGGV
jgi:hypothetical protein